MPDPRAAVHGLITAVLRRQWVRLLAWAVAFGVTAGAAVTGVMSMAGRPGLRAGVALGVIASIVVVTPSFRRVTRAAAARAVERARPSCRNLLITAEELERHPDRAHPSISARVFAEAARAVGGLEAGSVVPVRGGVLALVAALTLALVVTPRGMATVQSAMAEVSDALPGIATSLRVRVTVQSPDYAGRPAAVLTDPERIDALEGSRILFDTGTQWRVRFGTSAAGREFVARESGYFALDATDDRQQRRLIPLNVVRDRAPLVRIEAPAKDLLLPDGSRDIPVTMSASDDLGLQMLELRYTKVSGSGEQFEFVEGTLPVTLQPTSGTDWRADATLALSTLRLGPGDSLVYRAVARDQRSGDIGFAASDTYFVEISGPGQVALEGVEMPPELERYAMSQQMIVLRIERLRAREAAMARPAIVEEAASIAAEQRTVRANFVFLLGGHVEDEEVEAEQSHEIQEGRLENTARKDINAAVSQMTRAEQGLTAVNIAAALPPARAAVEALQRAFGRSRYLLRSLAVRSRLDPSRRLTGDLEGAADWRRVPSDADGRPGAAVRALLVELIEAVQTTRSGRTLEPARSQQLAETALAVDPASATWQEVSRQLLGAADARALELVIGRVAPELRRNAVPRTALSETDSPLVRAFKAERRP